MTDLLQGSNLKYDQNNLKDIFVTNLKLKLLIKKKKTLYSLPWFYVLVASYMKLIAVIAVVAISVTGDSCCSYFDVK